MKSPLKKRAVKRPKTSPVFLRLDTELLSSAEMLAKETGLKLGSLISMALKRLVKSGI